MPVTILSHEDAKSCLEHVATDIKLQNELSESEELAVTDGKKLPNKLTMLVTSRLSRIPLSEWGNLRVSKRSFLRDLVWDFQGEGTFFQSCRTKVLWAKSLTDGIKLTDAECEPLLLCIQGCLYCYLPQNNYLGYCTSYNSVSPMQGGFLKIGRFLYGRRILVDCNGNSQFVGATAITPADVRECIDSEPALSGKCVTGKAWAFWQKLSDNGNLPLEYSLRRGTVDLDDYQSELNKERHESHKSYMPISLEVLSEVVPHCRKLVEKYCNEIMDTYDLLHPLLCGDKRYREQKGSSWENAFNILKEKKSDLWKLEDFYVENGSSGTLDLLKKAIRKHPDWPDYRKKNFPRPSKTLTDLSYGQLVAMASDNGLEIPTEGAYPPGRAEHLKLRSAIQNIPDWRQKRKQYLPTRYDLGVASKIL